MATELSRRALRRLDRRVKCPDLAQDLCQDLFVQLLQAKQTPIENPDAYLMTSLRHVIAEHYSQNKRKTVPLELAELAGDLPHVEDATRDTAAKQALLQAVGRMPNATWRDVFIDSELNGESEAQVAARYQITEVTVRTYRSRARAWVLANIRSKGEHDHEQ
jgi:RNA polymerase sigma factor (sigma-70 family)